MTDLVLIGFGAASGIAIRGIEQNDTPWAGAFERVNAYALMAWLVVLAVTMIRRSLSHMPPEQDAAPVPERSLAETREPPDRQLTTPLAVIDMSTTMELPPKLHPVDPTARRRPGFVERHAVATFCALTFAISFGGVLLVLGRDGLFSTGATMAGAGALILIGPSVASLLLTGLVGRPGFRELGSRLRRWRVGVRWYAVAILTGPVVMGATVFGLSRASPEFRPEIATADDKLSITGLVMGLLWGAWHFPLFAGDTDPEGALPAALLVAALLFAWLIPYRSSWCGCTTGPRAC